MIFHDGPHIDSLVASRQETIRDEAHRSRQPRTPSTLRIMLGLALIRIGEQVRDHTQAPATKPALRPAPTVHQA